MTTHRIFAWAAVLVVSAAAISCSGGKSSATSTAQPPASATDATGAAATPDATEIAQANALADLAPLTLGGAEIPAGFRVRSNQPVSARDISTANAGIPHLLAYFRATPLDGAWTVFYSRDQPASGLSSIVYRFGQAAGARGLVDATAALTSADYLNAISVERVQSGSVGDMSQFMRYTLPGARTLEFTWTQGRLAGQIILRYSGDQESPDDVALVVSLARKQAEKMQAYVQ